MTSNDREYEILVEPGIRFRLSFEGDERIRTATATLEDRRDGGRTDEPADPAPEGGIELWDRRVDVRRDGESLLDADVAKGLAAIEQSLRGGDGSGATRGGESDRAGESKRDAADEGSGEPVDAAQPGESSGTPFDDAKARFEVFRDRGDEWRWRLVHDNGNVIATSGEGYTAKVNARKGIRSVKRNARGAAVEDG